MKMQFKHKSHDHPSAGQVSVCSLTENAGNLLKTLLLNKMWLGLNNLNLILVTSVGLCISLPCEPPSVLLQLHCNIHHKQWVSCGGYLSCELKNNLKENSVAF